MADQSESVPQPGFGRPGPAAFPSVPDHELIRLIGAGSYGQVWLARNAVGVFRAVKIVHEKTFRHSRPFEREFRGVKKFEPISRLHEGLVDILQIGRNEERGYFYCVMELADDLQTGQAIDPETYSPHTLTAEIARHKRLPIEQCQTIGVAIASALDFLHARGLIHRDIKPSNIIFVDGHAKLADIGLVAELSEAKSYVGTEGFIPPEGPGTVQADIYSLGKVLYEITTGKDRHEYPDLPPPLDETVQERGLMELNKIVLKACRHDVSERYPSAAALARDLAELRYHEPAPARWKFWAAAALAITAAGVAFIAARRSGTAASSAPASPGPPGLVARWRAEGDYVDDVGGIAGIPRREVTFVPGKFGRAFHFNGLNSGVVLGNPPALHLQNFTIEGWIKRDDPKVTTREGWADAFLFGFGHNGYGLALRTNGMPILTLTGSYFVSPPGNFITDTNWHHLAVTKSGTAVMFFLDGVGSPATQPFVWTFQFDRNAGLGVSGEILRNSFFGAMDEFKVYNRALAPAEIRAIYHAATSAEASAAPTKPAPALALPGLIHRWSGENDARDNVG
jgi:hypothetical protein